MKVLWSTAQIISTIAYTIDLNFPSPFAEIVTALGTLTQFDVADGLALEVRNDKSVTAISLPYHHRHHQRLRYNPWSTDLVHHRHCQCYNPWFADYHIKVIVSSTIPIIIVLIIWGTYLVRRWSAKNDEELLQIYSTHMSLTILITYLGA